MNTLSIGIIGGHPDTARSVVNSRTELEQTCGTKLRIVDIPCSREGRHNTKRIKSKIVDCQLIFLIVRYGGHDLNNIVWQLKRKATIMGNIIILPGSISKTGVMKAIEARVLNLG